MEDYLKPPADTTSSNFYPSPPASKKNNFHQVESNPNRIPQLEAKLQALMNVLRELKDHYEKICSDEILDDFQKQKISNLEDIRMQNQEIQRNLKMEIHSKYERLDKELQELHRQRMTLRGKYQILLDDGIEEVKALKQSVFNDLNKLKKQKNQQLKVKSQELKKDCQGFRKNQKKFKREIINDLEMIKNKFNERISIEENKRNKLENIISNLLEKTCKQAENSMRRKLYEQPAVTNLPI